MRRASVLRLAAALTSILCGSAGAQNVTQVRIDLAQEGSPISPYIYGTNLHGNVEGFSRYTVVRLGGNSVSTYNWENNCNNSGADWRHANVKWVAGFAAGSEVEGQPASAYKHALLRARAMECGLSGGAYTLIQLPMAGYVAADDAGPVGEDAAAPSPRWKRVVAAKSTPFSAPPDASDDVVYIDEAVAHLVSAHGAGDAGGVRGWALCNEADIWFHTHPRVHPQRVEARELVRRSVEWAKAIKRVDPTAEVFGPSLTHAMGYDSLNLAPDWEQIKASGGYRWFIDYYLDEMRKASEQAGMRLLDVLDVHAYTDSEVAEAAGLEGVLHGARWLWDPAHVQASWIGEVYPQHLPLLPRLQESIAARYPGTRLAITEYNPQRIETIHGSLALADMLGVFGREGLYLATLWSLLPYDDADGAWRRLPAQAALRLYRDFDGAGATFGDRALTVSNSDDRRTGAYAARDSRAGNVHLILLGRTRHMPQQVRIELAGTGAADFDTAEVWGYGQDNLHVGFLERKPVRDGRLELTLTKLTARHVVFSRGGSGFAAAPPAEMTAADRPPPP